MNAWSGNTAIWLSGMLNTCSSGNTDCANQSRFVILFPERSSTTKWGTKMMAKQSKKLKELQINIQSCALTNRKKPETSQQLYNIKLVDSPASHDWLLNAVFDINVSILDLTISACRCVKLPVINSMSVRKLSDKSSTLILLSGWNASSETFLSFTLTRTSCVSSAIIMVYLQINYSHMT